MSNVLHSVQSRLKHRKVLGVGESADGNFPRSKICQLLGNDHLNHIVIEQGKYPRGLRVYQWVTCFVFGALGMVNVFFPHYVYSSIKPTAVDSKALTHRIADDFWKEYDANFTVEHDSDEQVIWPGQRRSEFLGKYLEKHFEELSNPSKFLDISVRLYGSACFSLCALFFIVAVINKDNRRAIRIALFVEAMYFIVDTLVTVFTVKQMDTSYKLWFTDHASVFWITMLKIFGSVLGIYYAVMTNPARYAGHKRSD